MIDYKVTDGQLTFGESEWMSIAHHLRVAAERYDENAKQVPELNITLKAQSEQARKLAEIIEELS